MTLAELNTILNTTGYSVAYGEFEHAVGFPAICFYERDSNNLFADGISYYTQTRKVVELYTDYKDPVAEGKIETLFLQNEIAWDKTETRIEDEHCYLIAYEIEV